MGRREDAVEGAIEKNIRNLWGKQIRTLDSFVGGLEKADWMILIRIIKINVKV